MGAGNWHFARESRQSRTSFFVFQLTITTDRVGFVTFIVFVALGRNRGECKSLRSDRFRYLRPQSAAVLLNRGGRTSLLRRIQGSDLAHERNADVQLSFLIIHTATP